MSHFLCTVSALSAQSHLRQAFQTLRSWIPYVFGTTLEYHVFSAIGTPAHLAVGYLNNACSELFRNPTVNIFAQFVILRFRVSFTSPWFIFVLIYVFRNASSCSSGFPSLMDTRGKTASRRENSVIWGVHRSLRPICQPRINISLCG